MRNFLLLAVCIAHAGPALAQVSAGPLAGAPLAGSGSPIRTLARPQLTLISPPPPAGRETTLRFRLSALGSATAVKLERFRPGCKFEQKPDLAGSPFRLDRQMNLLLQTGSNYTMLPDLGVVVSQGMIVAAPEGPSFPVVNGAAEFSITGVPGVDGKAFSTVDEKSGPDQQILSRVNALAGYQRTIVGAADCEPRAVVLVRDADGKWRLLKPDGSRQETSRGGVSAEPLRGTRYAQIARRRVTVTNTKTLRIHLHPLMEGPKGASCLGASMALGSPTYPIGIRDSDDGHLVFRIRSGPQGTQCAVAMRFRDLPVGVTATARFSIRRDGTKCSVGEGTMLDAAFVIRLMLLVMGRSSSSSPEPTPQMLMPKILADAGTFQVSQIGWLDPFSKPDGSEIFRWQSNGAPILGLLNCSSTLLNDHGIELRLDSADFDVPDGVSYP